MFICNQKGEHNLSLSVFLKSIPKHFDSMVTTVREYQGMSYREYYGAYTWYEYFFMDYRDVWGCKKK